MASPKDTSVLITTLSTLVVIIIITGKLYSQNLPNVQGGRAALRESHAERLELRVTSTYSNRKRENADSTLALVGRWPLGPCYAAAARGNYAFIGNGALIQAYDLSNPTAPYIVGEYLTGTPDYVTDIQLRDDLAFVCNGDSLIILDVGVPSHIARVSAVDMFGPTYVQLAGSYAYVLGSTTLRVVDISDVHAPILRGGFPSPFNVPTGVALKLPYAYLAGAGTLPTSIEIINVGNPDSLYWVNNFRALLIPQSIAVSETLLLTSGPGFNEPDALKIYSLADPSLPSLIAALPELNGLSIAIQDSLAYVGADSNMYVISIANPRMPSELGRVLVIADDIQLNADRSLVAGVNKASVVDVTQPDSQRVRSCMPTGENALAVAVQDTIAYVASGHAGLWLVSVANPDQPRSISNITSGGYRVSEYDANLAVDVFISGALAYVANYDGELTIYNVQDAQAPRLLGRSLRNTSGRTSKLTKSNTLVFQNDFLYGVNDTMVRIIDVVDPTHPIQVGAVCGDYFPYDVSVHDSTLFVATSTGLRTYNVSHPEAPTLLWVYAGDIRSTVVKDTLLYAAGNVLSIFSIARLDSPYVLAHLSRPADYNDMCISGHFLYLSAFQDGGIIDISNPRMPRELGGAPFGGPFGGGIAAEGPFLYSSATTRGLYILRNSLVIAVAQQKDMNLPNGYWLSQNYPNPFNPTTRFDFSVSTYGMVEVGVFDLLGREVTSLVHEKLAPGKYTTEWNSTGFSSGVYLCRLAAYNVSLSRKVLLIK